MRKRFCLSLLVLAVSLVWAVSSCETVQIKEGATCSVAGVLSAGGICSRLIGPETNNLSFSEFVDFLEAQPVRQCVPVPGFNVCAEDQSTGVAVPLPARAGAIAMSDADWSNLKTEMEVACRYLGSKCSKELKNIIEVLNKRLVDNRATFEHTKN